MFTFSYDFAFVDAEKKMNQEYFELLLQLVKRPKIQMICYFTRLRYLIFPTRMQVRVGGVIVVDNVLWHGRVADPLVNMYQLFIIILCEYNL